ncbi:ATP-binding protein [Streptomyces sp. NPDC102437]|uniref:ATP-binding protein n=1 Tax=Streptomyces sp. NPDC102437 TaxID=3366175 RepID=UPI003825153A
MRPRYAEPATPVTSLTGIAPVAEEWSRTFDFLPGAAQLARLHTRTRLTMFRWSGNSEGATQAAGILVGNAVAHADPGPTAEDRQVRLRLAITEDHELTIEVRDPIPQFRDFEQAPAGQERRGLWTLRRLGGELSWFLCHDRVGKTVRARMTPGPVPA